MRRACVVFLLAMAACTHPAKLETALTVTSGGPGVTVFTLKVKNEEAGATTPLAVTLSVRPHVAGEWGAEKVVLHPSPFVLNKREEQILRATVRMQAESVRATVSVKEAETGRQLKKDTSDVRVTGR